MITHLPLVAFTTLLVWAAGTFGAQGAYALRRMPTKAQPVVIGFSFALLLAGVVVMLVYAGSQGRLGDTAAPIAAALVMGLAMFVFFGAHYRAGEDGFVPVGVGVLAIASAIVMCVALVVPNLTSGSPHGNPALLLCLSLGNACLLGAATTAYVHARMGEGVDSLLVLLGSIVNGLTMLVYILFLGVVVVTPANEAANAPTMLSGDNSVLVWLGAVIIGALLPVLFGFLGQRSPNWRMLGFYTIVAALIGTVYVRVVVCHSGLSLYLF